MSTYPKPVHPDSGNGLPYAHVPKPIWALRCAGHCQFSLHTGAAHPTKRRNHHQLRRTVLCSPLQLASAKTSGTKDAYAAAWWMLSSRSCTIVVRLPRLPRRARPLLLLCRGELASSCGKTDPTVIKVSQALSSGSGTVSEASFHRMEWQRDLNGSIGWIFRTRKG